MAELANEQREQKAKARMCLLLKLLRWKALKSHTAPLLRREYFKVPEKKIGYIFWFVNNIRCSIDLYWCHISQYTCDHYTKSVT